eukprot:g74517.t1
MALGRLVFLLLIPTASAQTWQTGGWTNCSSLNAKWSRSVTCVLENGTEVSADACTATQPLAAADCVWSAAEDCQELDGTCKQEMKADCQGLLGTQNCSEAGASLRTCPTEDCEIPFGKRDLGTGALMMALAVSVLLMIGFVGAFCYAYARAQKIFCFERLLTPAERKARANAKREAALARDDESDFKQQNFDVWVPNLTPRSVMCTFFVVGLWCMLMGGLLWRATNSVVEVEARYDDLSDTHCVDTQPDMPAPVFIYYKLVDFYQTHQNYVQSRDERQIRSADANVPEDQLDYETCNPMARYGDMATKHRGSAYNASLEKKYLFPCGLIAHTVFTDTFSNPRVCTSKIANSNTTQQCLACECLRGNNFKKEGIAWESDLKVRFKDRPPYSGETNMNPRGFQMPAVDDEDFVVWMRCSHLPHFYKIYRQILDRDIWGGQKWVVLTTLTWTGSSDWVLVGAHFLMAILCFLAGLFFFINNQAGRLKTQSDNYAVLEMQSMIPSGPSRAASFRDVATPPTLSRPVSAVHNSRKLEISDQKLDVSSHSLQH